MPDLTFTAKDGVTIARKDLISCLNTGESTEPTWSIVGIRVYDSQEEFDWQEETNTDICGNVYSNLSEPIITQNFDGWEMSGGDVAAVKIWNQAIKDHDVQAMANNDMLIVHRYVYSDGTSKFWAERYKSCKVAPSSLGGSGGGNLTMPTTVTYGGERSVGSVTYAAGAFTFTADVA